MIQPRINRRPSRTAPATFDAAGRIVSRGHSQGDPSQPSQMSQSFRKTYDCDAFGRPTGYALGSGGAGGSPAAPLSSVTYANGSGGAGGSPAEPDATVAYSYDTLGRFASVSAGGSRDVPRPLTTFACSYLPGFDLVSGYSSNNIVARYAYDAWGNVLDEEVSVPALAGLRYRFQGREWSAAAGLVHFRLRWYQSHVKC